MKYPMDIGLIIKARDWWGQWFNDKAVPAMVGPEVMSHTCPKGAKDFRLYGKYPDTVVASAEQSFLQLDKDGELEKGDWMAITPCYRSENTFDEAHLPVFLKLELIRLGDYSTRFSNSDALQLALGMRQFFLMLCGMPTEIVRTKLGWDVMYGDLELGSYGVRKTLTGKSYVYGTGLAEPRSSKAIISFKEG